MLVSISVIAIWFIGNYAHPSSERGFKIIPIGDNALLLSDADVVSYNWTSQEMALTDEASGRLQQTGDNLYNFTGFVVKINGDEVYRGVFRSPFMSATPAPPKISIMFPSVLFPSDVTNYHAVRLFFPDFQPPSSQAENNTRLAQFFEGVNKLCY